jgi:hypothetical protein
MNEQVGQAFYAPHHRPVQEPFEPATIVSRWRRIEMHQLIYLVGLIVVILAVLSFFGLR